MDTIVLENEDGEELKFYVLEETTVGGKDYFLVTEEAEGDGEQHSHWCEP